MSPEQATHSWFLHSQGRRFGPLAEDELRGYFRAGMVKAGDLITVPGELTMKPAAEVAQRMMRWLRWKRQSGSIRATARRGPAWQ